jgi:hypothetical protein
MEQKINYLHPVKNNFTALIHQMATPDKNIPALIH